MVPPAEFTSYYGKPVINPPVWHSPDIAGYFFLGGLAGASSLLGAGAQATGKPALARAAKGGALAAISLSLAGLVHDLGRPARFLNMLRVVKPTSPMSVGTWILAGYVPATGAAAASALTRRAPRLGAAASAAAALLGPAVAVYTAVLGADTAVPAWHEGHRELPFVFAGSAAVAAAGLGLLAAPAGQNVPARNLALLGAGTEAAAFELMTRRMGMVAEPYSTGRGGGYIRAGQVLSVLGAARGAARAAQPGGRRAVRCRAAGRLGGHPLGHVPCRAGLRQGSQVHGDPAAAAARRHSGNGAGPAVTALVRDRPAG